MKSIRLVLVVAGALAAGIGYAQSGANVLKAKGCLAFHPRKSGPRAAFFVPYHRPRQRPLPDD